MLLVERHIFDIFEDHLVEYNNQGKSAAFSSFIRNSADQGDAFFKLVLNHRILSLESDIFRRHLIDEQDLYTAEDLEEKINHALKLAQLLEIIYRYYLKIDRIADKFHAEQNCYRQWLGEDNAYNYHGFQNPEAQHKTLAKTIRNYSEQINFWRLLTIRTRRFFLLLVPVLNNLASYKSIISNIEIVLGPIAQHQGWIFFIPRLCTNLFLSFKHNINHYMTPEEQILDPMLRFRAQMDVERRWWELANDSVWFTANLLSAFVFAGGPVVFYISLALPFYDTLLSTLRAILEIGRLNDLKKQSVAFPDESWMHQESYLRELDRRVQAEIFQLIQRIIVNAIMFFSMSMALAIFSFNPLIPMIGALMAVITTIIGRIITQCRENLDSKESQDAVTKDLKQVFIKHPHQNHHNPGRQFGLFAPPLHEAMQSSRSLDEFACNIEPMASI